MEEEEIEQLLKANDDLEKYLTLTDGLSKKKDGVDENYEKTKGQNNCPIPHTSMLSKFGENTKNDMKEKNLKNQNKNGIDVDTTDMFADEEVQNYNGNISNKQMDQLNTINSVNAPTEDTFEDDEVQDMVDQEIFDCIAQDPVRNFLSQQASYISQLSTQNDDISSSEDSNVCDDNNCNYFKEPKTQSQSQSKSKLKQSIRKKITLLTSVLNLEYEKMRLRAHLHKKLLLELQDVREKQKEIQHTLNLLESESTDREPSLTRCFFKKFGMPYFSDSNGFAPPPNEDTKMKLERGELIVTEIPKTHHWVKLHKEMLQDEVKKTLIEEKSEKLVNEIKKYESLLKESDNISDEDKEKLMKQISKCQKSLRSVRNKSYMELVLAEDNDREYDWMKYSVTTFKGVHSPDECRKFWHVYLKPSINKDPWDDCEDLKLCEAAHQKNYEDWDAIAQLLNTGRSGFQCFIHFKTRLEGKLYHSEGKWTKEEDEKLLAVINASKIGDFIPWTKVSSYMANRKHNQIYNRWVNCLNPRLVKGRFSKDEDLFVVSGIEVFGATFKELAKLLQNRTSSQIRERYERHLLPKSAKIGTWSLEEDEKLLFLIQKHGEHNWSAIANEMKTRSRTQVRQRYSFIQHMTKNKPGWTIAKVKRRNCSIVNKNALRTDKYVEKLKKEVEEVEKSMKLSSVELASFRAKKLIELRDKIIEKKNRSRKKKPESDQVDDYLIEYFVPSSPPSALPNTKSVHENYDKCLYYITFLAKYFGIEYNLPENIEDVFVNLRLKYTSKFPLKLCNQTETLLENSMDESHFAVLNTPSNEAIDYTIPDRDDTIIMNEWWHSPPVDVTLLNFNEFFKRTVFDYSNGMHRDIWESKMKRHSKTALFNSCENDLPKQKTLTQLLHIPPNLHTIIGLKTSLLSKSVLNFFRTNEKELKRSNSYKDFIKNDPDVLKRTIKQYQNNILTLFIWPQVLSINDVSIIFSSNNDCQINGSVSPSSNSKRVSHKSRSPYDSIATDMQSIELSENSNHMLSEIVEENVSENTEDQKRKLTNDQSYVTCDMENESLAKKTKLNENNVTKQRGRPKKHKIPLKGENEHSVCLVSPYSLRQRNRPVLNLNNADLQTCEDLNSTNHLSNKKGEKESLSREINQQESECSTKDIK